MQRHRGHCFPATFRERWTKRIWLELSKKGEQWWELRAQTEVNLGFKTCVSELLIYTSNVFFFYFKVIKWICGKVFTSIAIITKRMFNVRKSRKFHCFVPENVWRAGVGRAMNILFLSLFSSMIFYTLFFFLNSLYNSANCWFHSVK